MLADLCKDAFMFYETEPWYCHWHETVRGLFRAMVSCAISDSICYWLIVETTIMSYYCLSLRVYGRFRSTKSTGADRLRLT